MDDGEGVTVSDRGVNGGVGSELTGDPQQQRARLCRLWADLLRREDRLGGKHTGGIVGLGAGGSHVFEGTCVYDMPADRDFVLDTLPGHHHVAVFNGAGHAGKFASLMGRILADLTTVGETDHDIAAFSLSRPAIIDPDYAGAFRFGPAA